MGPIAVAKPRSTFLIPGGLPELRQQLRCSPWRVEAKHREVGGWEDPLEVRFRNIAGKVDDPKHHVFLGGSIKKIKHQTCSFMREHDIINMQNNTSHEMVGNEISHLYIETAQPFWLTPMFRPH